MTNLVVEQESIPIWCEDCNRQGYIFIDDPEQPCFVVCKTCGWETSQVWCPKCGMGGEFVEEINKHPTSWNCPNCDTEYQLPQEFYEESVALIAEKELPPHLRQLILSRKSLVNLFKFLIIPKENRVGSSDEFYSPENKLFRRTVLLVIMAYLLIIILAVLIKPIK
jgi:hypothetical protein